MDPERFQAIQELYHAARADRAVLDHADPALRLEVESLLAQCASLPELAGASTVTEIVSGTQLGPYRIEALIGAGGMGQVFRGIDTRLGRAVAIKVVYEHFSERFDREARAISALNHPHICTLYDVGPNYLVMELLEGETLAARLNKGKLSIERTIQYGAQIADALAAAHAKGIIHRDLKPGNIMLTKTGTKVLDFGLAKSTRDERLTASQAVMGTPAYMAPEQREGKECDALTDIYGLGLVLREMTTGKREATTEGLPAHLAHVIDRCLAADPESRWHSAKDVQLELAWSGPAPARENKAGLPWWPAAAAAVTLAALTLAVIHFREKSPAQQALRYTISAPENATILHSFAISPDSRFIAIAAVVDGQRQLWLRALNSLRFQPMPGTEDAAYPFWSPDSRYIGFFAEDKLKKIAAGGGPAQSLCEAPDSRGGSWNGDDAIVFASSGGGAAIQRVSAAGGVPSSVTKRNGSALFPAFLPDGRRFLYTLGSLSPDQNGVYLSSLDGRENRRILADVSRAVLGPDRLLFVRENTLTAERFDAAVGQPVGDPFPIAGGVSFTTNTNYAPVTVSQTGVLVYESGASSGNNQLAWYDQGGKLLDTLVSGSVFDPAISPDEKSVVFRRTSPSGADLWVRDLTRGTEQRFTTDASSNVGPSWSPRGDRVVFSSSRGGGTANLYQSVAGGTGPDQLLLANSNNKGAAQWSRDGRFIVYVDDDGKTKRDIWVLPMDRSRERKPFAFLRTEFNEFFGQLSPDSQWMAYTSDESGQREVYVRPFPAGEGQWKISLAGGEQPRWRGDGRELYFVAADGKMMAVGAHSGVRSAAGNKPSFEPGAPRPLFEAHLIQSLSRNLFEYDVTRDGKRFLLATTAAGQRTAPPLTVVVNGDAGPSK